MAVIPEFLGAGPVIIGDVPFPEDLTITSGDIPTGMSYGDRLIIVIMSYSVEYSINHIYDGLDDYELVHFSYRSGVVSDVAAINVYTTIWSPDTILPTISAVNSTDGLPFELDMSAPRNVTSAFWRVQCLAWSPAGEWLPNDDSSEFPVNRTRTSAYSTGGSSTIPFATTSFGYWDTKLGDGWTGIAITAHPEEGTQKTNSVGVPISGEFISGDYGDIVTSYGYTERVVTDPIPGYGGAMKVADLSIVTPSDGGFLYGPRWGKTVEYSDGLSLAPAGVGILFSLVGNLDGGDTGWRIGFIG